MVWASHASSQRPVRPTSGSGEGLLADRRRGADRAIRLPRHDATTAEIADRYRKLTSHVLDLIVPPERWIARPEEEHLRRLLAEMNTRGVCLLGGPGSGKTALLARKTMELSQAGSLVVAIKADLISPEVSLSSWARRQVDLDIELIDGIMAVSSLGKVAVVINQLDALASLANVKPERLNELVELIRQCRDIPNVTVVCSCRELEYRAAIHV